jgi:hypothetical protein
MQEVYVLEYRGVGSYDPPPFVGILAIMYYHQVKRLDIIDLPKPILFLESNIYLNLPGDNT